MDEKETNRLEAFSDGVFAVAITLLVLNIKVPGLDSPGELLDDTHVWQALLNEWPLVGTTACTTCGSRLASLDAALDHGDRSHRGHRQSVQAPWFGAPGAKEWM